MATKSLCRSFSGIDSFLFRGDKLVGYVLGIEVGKERHRSFVIQDLYYDMMTELAKECVGGGGSQAYQTFYHSVHMSSLTKYPGLSHKVVRRNMPQSPATGLDHITASRSNVRSSRISLTASTSKLAHSAQPTAFVESLDHYPPSERPDTLLRCTFRHSSDFRCGAIFSNLPGRFPARAKDGSEYLLLSAYKTYIHVETLPDRSSPHLCAAY
jgi:hypothetical protein